MLKCKRTQTLEAMWREMLGRLVEQMSEFGVRFSKDSMVQNKALATDWICDPSTDPDPMPLRVAKTMPKTERPVRTRLRR